MLTGVLSRVYENGEVDVCVPPNVPGRIMSKVEACQRRMKRNRKHKMVVPLSNYDQSGGSKEDDDNDDWSKVEESKASMKPGAARKRRTKAKKQKRMLFSALMKTAIAARRRITQTRKAALMLDLFPDESSFSFQRVLAVERANAEFKKRVNLQKKVCLCGKVVIRVGVSVVGMPITSKKQCITRELIGVLLAK